MISTAIVLYLLLAIINSVRVGVVTTVALAKGKPPPVQRHPGDSVARTIGRAVVRGFVDDLAERRTAGAELRTRKRAVREGRRTDRWERRQAKRRPTGTDDLDDRIPDWARGRTDDHRPDGDRPDDADDHEPVRRRRDRPDPAPSGDRPESPPPDRPDEDRPSGSPDDGLLDFLFGDNPDGAPPTEETPPEPPAHRPPANPAAPPPDPPPTNPRPGRPHLYAVPDLPAFPAFPGGEMDPNTLTGSGEVSTITRAAGGIEAFGDFLGSGADWLRTMHSSLTAPVDVGGMGLSDPDVVDPLTALLDLLAQAQVKAGDIGEGLVPHINAVDTVSSLNGAAAETKSYARD